MLGVIERGVDIERRILEIVQARTQRDRDQRRLRQASGRSPGPDQRADAGCPQAPPGKRGRAGHRASSRPETAKSAGTCPNSSGSSFLSPGRSFLMPASMTTMNAVSTGGAKPTRRNGRSPTRRDGNSSASSRAHWRRNWSARRKSAGSRPVASAFQPCGLSGRPAGGRRALRGKTGWCALPNCAIATPAITREHLVLSVVADEGERRPSRNHRTPVPRSGAQPGPADGAAAD